MAKDYMYVLSVTKKRESYCLFYFLSETDQLVHNYRTETRPQREARGLRKERGSQPKSVWGQGELADLTDMGTSAPTLHFLQAPLDTVLALYTESA